MNPAQGFQTRQSALKKLAEAQEDKKYAEKTLDLKTHQRDALARGVEALPGLREESAGTSLAAVVDSKVEALREEITEARNALEADKKKVREEAARLEKEKKTKEAEQKSKEQEENRRRAQEERERLALLSPEARDAELKRKAEEKKAAAEAAKQEAARPKGPVAKGPEPEKINPFADREQAIRERKEVLDSLAALQRLLVQEPWLEESNGWPAALERAGHEVTEAKRNLASAAARLEDAERASRVYIDAAPGKKATLADEAFYESFEKDISHKKARELEVELASLREKLRSKFPDEPVASVAKCQVRDQLKKHLDELEKEIDSRAHKARCHRCNTENSVARTEEAKTLIRDKVAELKKRANEEGDTLEHKLARALEKIATTQDENGESGGKMLGVLICEDEDKNTVLIWAYSGTLNPDSRGAGAEVVRLQRLLEAPDEQRRNDQELQAIEQALKEKAGDKKKYDAAIKQIDAKAKKDEEKPQSVFDEERKQIIANEEVARKAAADKQKLLIEEAKAEYESTAAAGGDAAARARKRYSEALSGASDWYQKVTNESQERQREATEEAQKRLDKALAEIRQNADNTKNDVAKELGLDKLQELERKKTQLQKEKEELVARMQDRQKRYGQDVEKLNQDLAAAELAVGGASARDTEVEAATGPTWERPVQNVLKSKSGDSVTLAELNHEHEGTPHGVCSAPKMVQAAYAKNLKVLAMAEAWYGGGANTHGELVASCNTCMKNIGFQLCENNHG